MITEYNLKKNPSQYFGSKMFFIALYWGRNTIDSKAGIRTRARLEIRLVTGIWVRLMVKVRDKVSISFMHEKRSFGSDKFVIALKW